MTPKDKAKELVGKFYVNIPLRDCDNRRPHKLALIAVDEIHEALKQTFHQVHKKTEMTPNLYLSESIAVHYYQQVKKEIEKL
jgi:hypothetical protein